MSKSVSYVRTKKNKNNLNQWRIAIDVECGVVLDKLLKNKMPFTVTGKEEPAWRNEKFEKTDFSKDVQDLLKTGWENVIETVEEISSKKGNVVNTIIITIVVSGPHIISIFQIDYHYNDEEDYGHCVDSYTDTQQVEEYYYGYTGEPAYLPTEELLIELNLDLEKKYKRKCIFKNIGHLSYRT